MKITDEILIEHSISKKKIEVEIHFSIFHFQCKSKTAKRLVLSALAMDNSLEALAFTPTIQHFHRR